MTAASPPHRPAAPPATDPPADGRVVLLGASNLSISARQILSLIRAGFGGESLDVLFVAGHGRSYGLRTRVAGRGLPPIVGCGVWDALRDDPCSGRTRVLVTDVGNDLLYGVRPAVLIGWVATCLDRFGRGRHGRGGVDLTVTLPPVERAERLTAAHYHAARAVLFPFHRPLPWPEMLGRVRETTDRLADLARSRGAAVVVPDRGWYGADPIHVRRGRRGAAWRRIFSHWPGFDATADAPRLRVPPAVRPRRPDEPVRRAAGQPAAGVHAGGTAGVAVLRS